MENQQKETFHYTYSAKEQAEIKAIRQKYAPSAAEEDKMAQLRRLDTAVTEKATALSLACGIVGALIMGSGMSLAMTDIGTVLGVSAALSMMIGIILGIVGIVFVCVAYPLYNRVLKRERERIAPEIIRLSDELMK